MDLLVSLVGMYINTLHFKSQILRVINSLVAKYHKEIRDKDQLNVAITVNARQEDSLTLYMVVMEQASTIPVSASVYS